MKPRTTQLAYLLQQKLNENTTQKYSVNPDNGLFEALVVSEETDCIYDLSTIIGFCKEHNLLTYYVTTFNGHGVVRILL